MDEKPSAPIVLVVDDAPETVEMISAVLHEMGCQVVAASSGAEGRSAAERVSPDLVILDCILPDIPGVELCRILKADERFVHVPVIMVTGIDREDILVSALEQGADNFLTKPFSPSVLRARVATQLRTRRLTLELRDSLRDAREAQEELRRAEKMRDSLVHMLIHDMKAPVSGIMGYIQLLMQATEPLDPRRRAYLQMAHRNCVALNHMMRDILDVSAADHGRMRIQPEIFSLPDLLASVSADLDFMTRPGNKRITLRLPSYIPPIEADRDMIRRIVVNLLTNALKHTHNNGEVFVEAGFDPAADSAWLCVRDRGEGIPPEFHQRIFEKFAFVEHKSRMSRTDTGLGLAFCKLAAEAHAGSIRVESAEGRGAAFTLTIPRVSAARADTGTAPSLAAPAAPARGDQPPRGRPADLPATAASPPAPAA
jgi:two-component system sensor histidine kinase/response regulator